MILQRLKFVVFILTFFVLPGQVRAANDEVLKALNQVIAEVPSLPHERGVAIADVLKGALSGVAELPEDKREHAGVDFAVYLKGLLAGTEGCAPEQFEVRLARLKWEAANYIAAPPITAADRADAQKAFREFVGELPGVMDATLRDTPADVRQMITEKVQHGLQGRVSKIGNYWYPKYLLRDDRVSVADALNKLVSFPEMRGYSTRFSQVAGLLNNPKVDPRSAQQQLEMYVERATTSLQTLVIEAADSLYGSERVRKTYTNPPAELLRSEAKVSQQIMARSFEQTAQFPSKVEHERRANELLTGTGISIVDGVVYSSVALPSQAQANPRRTAPQTPHITRARTLRGDGSSR